jgi:alpha-beta hydrolase superfamily lysophospholipase
MGGLIAQKLAERGLVEAAVFLTPASPAGARINDPRVLRTFWSVIQVGMRKLPGTPVKLGPKAFSWGVLNMVEKQRHAAIYRDALFDSGQVYRDLLDPPGIDEAKVDVPTLTIGSRRDRATPVRGVRKVARKYARAGVPGDYLEYPRNGHWILDEPGTDEVFADIITWLSRKMA